MPGTNLLSFLVGTVAGGVLTFAFCGSRPAAPGLPAPLREEVPEPEPVPEPERAAPAARPVSTPDAEPVRRSHAREVLPRTDLMPTAPLDRQCELRGRVVGELGDPAGSRSFHVEVRFGAHAITGYATTDREGRFSFVVRGVLPPDTAGRLELEPGKPAHGLQMYTPAAVAASTALPDPLPTGQVDVGDLHLASRALVGAGVVEDSAGRPVGGAEVGFAVSATAAAAPTWFTVRTDDAGRFELRFPGEVGHARVSIRKSGFLPVVPRPIRVGDGQLRFGLSPAVSLAGRIAAPGGQRVEVQLVPSDGAVRRGATTWWSPETGTLRFRFDDVPPGPATFRYGLSGHRLVELRVDVRLGESGEHPALRDLRL